MFPRLGRRYCHRQQAVQVTERLQSFENVGKQKIGKYSSCESRQRIKAKQRKIAEELLVKRLRSWLPVTCSFSAERVKGGTEAASA